MFRSTLPIVPTFLLAIQNVLMGCVHLWSRLGEQASGRSVFGSNVLGGRLLFGTLGPLLVTRHPAFLFSLHGHRVLPAMALLAVLAPGFRSRRAVPAPLETVWPEAAQTLLCMRRDPTARFSTSTAGSGAVALEDGVEGHLLVYYVGARGTVTIAGGWLGAGRRRYAWLPLRPTLTWNGSDGHTLNAEELATLAADLHTGLDQMNTRHVLEEFFEPAPIPEEERRGVFDSYAAFMGEHGWQVTYDEGLTRSALKQTQAAAPSQQWSNADREALTRLEALVSEMLKGVRSSSRILFQTR